jgi:hypothetical protein
MRDPTRDSGSLGFGNVAWRERIDGWKMKPEKNTAPMSVSNAPLKAGVVEILMPAPMCSWMILYCKCLKQSVKLALLSRLSVYHLPNSIHILPI